MHGAGERVRRASASRRRMLGVALISAGVAALPLRAQGRVAWRLGTEPVALELRIDDDTSATVVARMRGDGTTWLPLRIIAQLAGVRASLNTRVARSASVRGAQAHGTLVKTASVRASDGNAPRPADVVQDADTTWVTVPRLAQWLGVQMNVNIADAVLSVHQVEHLPGVERRHVQRLAAAQLAAHQAERPATVRNRDSDRRAAQTISRGQVSLDYSVLLQRRGAAGSASWRESAGWGREAVIVAATRLGGGVLSGTFTAIGDPDPHIWRRSLQSTRWIRRDEQHAWRGVMQLGATADVGPLSGTLFGIGLGSPPLDGNRQRTVSLTRLAEARWSYAAMANGEWLPVTVRDGRVVMDIPVRGDLARYELYGWSEDGDRQRHALLVQSPVELLERGQRTQQSSVGVCPDALMRGAFASYWGAATTGSNTCRWRGGTEWRYGLTRTASVRSGMQLSDAWQAPFVGATTTLWSHTVFDLWGGVVRSSLRGSPARVTANGSAQLTWNPAPSTFISLSGRQLHDTRTAAMRIRLGLPAFGDALAIEHTMTRMARLVERPLESVRVNRNATQSLSRTSLVANTRGARAELFAQQLRVGAGFFERSTGVDLALTPGWMRVADTRWWFRGSMSRVQSARAAPWRADLRLNGRFLGADVEVARVMQRPLRASTNGFGATSRWILTVSPSFRAARISSSVVRNLASSGDVSTSGTMHRASGSVLLDLARGRVRVGGEAQADRGRLDVQLWLDRNGNGRQEADEPLVNGVRVVAGNRTAVSDARGLAVLGALSAIDPVRVQLDTTSVPLPCWMPSRAEWPVQIVAASTVTLSVALDEGVVIEGAVARAQSTTGVLVVRARHATRGVVASAPVMSDGSYQLLSVPTGSVELSLVNASGDVLGSQRVELPALRGSASSTVCRTQRVDLNAAGATL